MGMLPFSSTFIWRYIIYYAQTAVSFLPTSRTTILIVPNGRAVERRKKNMRRNKIMVIGPYHVINIILRRMKTKKIRNKKNSVCHANLKMLEQFMIANKIPIMCKWFDFNMDITTCWLARSFNKKKIHESILNRIKRFKCFKLLKLYKCRIEEMVIPIRVGDDCFLGL